MNLTFYSNLSMNYWDWIYLGDEGATYANVTNGTYEYTVCAFNKYNYTYYWNFSVDDGTNTLNSDIFWFTTAANQSLCNETSFSNFTGDGIIMDESWLIGVIIIFSVFGMIAFIKQKRYHL